MGPSGLGLSRMLMGLGLLLGVAVARDWDDLEGLEFADEPLDWGEDEEEAEGTYCDETHCDDGEDAAVEVISAASASGGLLDSTDSGDAWADSDLTSALWASISTGDAARLRRLLDEHGRRAARARSADGRGPLFWAFEYNFPAMGTLLEAHGADPLATDAEGRTPHNTQNAQNRRDEGAENNLSPPSTTVNKTWIPCVDPDPPTCVALVAAGRCFSDDFASLDIIWSRCPTSCGVCPKRASPSVYHNNNSAALRLQDGETHSDSVSNLDCEERAARGDCWHEDRRKPMYRHCSKACASHKTWQGCVRSQILINAAFSRKPGKRYAPDIPCESAPECRPQCFAQRIIADANRATARLEAQDWRSADMLGKHDGDTVSSTLGPDDALLPHDPGACIAKAVPVRGKTAIVRGAVQANLGTNSVGLLWALVEPTDEASFCAWELLPRKAGSRGRPAKRLGLAAKIQGIATDDGDLQKVLAPPSRRAVWRPLTVTASREVRLYPVTNPEGRVWTCGIRYLFKGAEHPSTAPLCSTKNGMEDDLERPLPAAWYPPQYHAGSASNGRYSVQTGLWLAGFPFFSAHAHNMFILVGESPRISYNAPIEEDAWRGRAVRRRGAGGLTHSDCIMARCATPMRACYSSVACRVAMDEFYASLEFTSVIPHWSETSILAQLDQSGSSFTQALARRLEDAVTCYFEHCECQPLEFDEVKKKKRRRKGHRSNADTSKSNIPVVRYPGAISGKEMRTIRALGAELRAERTTHRSFGVDANGHLVTQLEPEFSSRPATAAILSKLKSLAVQSDVDMGWQLVDPETMRPRTIELLEYPGEHSASLGWHQDTQSALTVLLMMSDREDYEGGNLQHEHHDREYAAPLEKRGDVAVYRSHQYHRVTDTTKGLRVSMAIEFWHVATGDPLHSKFWDDSDAAALPGRKKKKKKKNDGRPMFKDAAAPFHDVCPR